MRKPFRRRLLTAGGDAITKLELLEGPRVTVLHNGIAVQNNVEIPRAPRAGLERGGFMRTMGPIMLQDHGDPVRYRNIWVRRLN